MHQNTVKTHEESCACELSYQDLPQPEENGVEKVSKLEKHHGAHLLHYDNKQGNRLHGLHQDPVDHIADNRHDADAAGDKGQSKGEVPLSKYLEYDKEDNKENYEETKDSLTCTVGKVPQTIIHHGHSQLGRDQLQQGFHQGPCHHSPHSEQSDKQKLKNDKMQEYDETGESLTCIIGGVPERVHDHGGEQKSNVSPPLGAPEKRNKASKFLKWAAPSQTPWLKGPKVEITHSQSARKYRVCNLARRSVQMQYFPLQLENGQTVECTMAKFFLDKYGIKLRYPGSPTCRWTRSTSTPSCPWRSAR